VSLDPVSQSVEHVGLWLDSLRRKPYLGRAAKLTIPFLKTPVKIVQFSTQVSPLGFIGADRNRIAKAHHGISYDQMLEQAAKMEGSTDPEVLLDLAALKERMDEVQWTAQERLGKAAVGMMLIGLGTIAAATGATMWEPPDDEKERKLFYDAGYRPYSFRVRGRWIPMMYLGPGMLAFALPAALKRAVESNPNNPHDGAFERISRILTALPQMLVDQLPVHGLSSILNALTGKQDYTWRRVAAGYVQQVIPASGFLRWVEQIIDPTYRKATTIGETIEANIPFLSEHVKAVQNSRGLPATADVMQAFQPYKIGIENPEYAAKAKDYPISKAIYNAAEEDALPEVIEAARRAVKDVPQDERIRLFKEAVLRRGDKIGTKAYQRRMARLTSRLSSEP
jgi:hypothetical protein